LVLEAKLVNSRKVFHFLSGTFAVCLLVDFNFASATLPVHKPDLEASKTGVRFGSQVLTINNVDGVCYLESRVRGNKEATGQLRLGLTGPCFLLTWQHNPVAIKSEISGGTPIGNMGDLMAWRYQRSKVLASTTIAIVIGDPVATAEQSSSLSGVRASYRCGVSLQGVSLEKDSSRLPRMLGVEKNTGTYCVEQGVDEKLFWLLANRKK
jgi:hypothetical protein